MSRRLRAFSLVELLVVIAILAVLMSLLIPALSAARGAARSVRCVANLKQWGNYVQLYASQYNGVLIPPAEQMDGAWIRWQSRLPILYDKGQYEFNSSTGGSFKKLDKGVNIMHCPEDVFSQSKNYFDRAGANVSYTYNATNIGKPMRFRAKGQISGGYKRIHQASNASEFMLLVEKRGEVSMTSDDNMINTLDGKTAKLKYSYQRNSFKKEGKSPWGYHGVVTGTRTFRKTGNGWPLVESPVHMYTNILFLDGHAGPMETSFIYEKPELAKRNWLFK